MAKKNTDRYGPFFHCEKKTLEENLFDLCRLYSILLDQATSIDSTKQVEFEASRNLLNNQRKAYLQEQRRETT